MPTSIYQAESGKLILTVSSSQEQRASQSNLEEIMQQLSSLAGVPISAQILLTSEGRLWKGGGLGFEKEEIFLFNRLVLTNAAAAAINDPNSSLNQAAAAESEQAPHMSIDIEPPVPSSMLVEAISSYPSNGKALGISERLDSFLMAFKSHVSYGKALLEIAQKHFLTCEQLLQEQFIQTKALEMAVDNLDSHAKSTYEAFNAFNNHAQKEFTKHASLLHSFPSDLLTLQQIPIHNSILKEKNRNLDDYVPKDKLYAWVNRCQTSHDHLIARTSQLADNVREIQAGSDAETLKMTGVELPKLQQLLESIRGVLGKVKDYQNSFERDLSRIESMAAEIRSPSPSEDPLHRIQALEALYRIHTQEYVPDITKYDRYVRETVVYFSDSKVHLTQVLQAKLLAVSHFQSLIASVNPTITTLTNALNMQSEALLQLLHVHRMGPAWGATLVEVVRRKEYVKLFLRKAKEMADILNQFRNQEQRRRDNFKAEIFRYIPTGLITGLDDPPPYCEISVSNTNDSLPNLVLEDISSFERLVSNIRSSHQHDPTGSDSISKLQATMLKMTPQLDNIGVDFEKLVGKSGLYDRARRLEEENKKLKAMLPTKLSPLASDFENNPNRRMSNETSSSHYLKQEDTIRAYESRIKSLEKLLQDRYRSQGELAESERLKSALEQERGTSDILRGDLQRYKAENERLSVLVQEQSKKISTLETDSQEIGDLYGELLGKHQALEQKAAEITVDLTNQKQLLVEVSAHLTSCLTSLKSTEDSVVRFDSIVIPDSIHSDNLRQMLRKVEDDIISQMALLANLKASLNESVGGESEDGQSVAQELVNLLHKVNDLEGLLRESESEVTEAQAREAVMEAENASFKKMLSKTTESLETHQQEVSQLNVALQAERAKTAATELMLLERQKDLKEKDQKILLIQTLQLQLRTSREALEDWAIISRVSNEVLVKFYNSWLQVQKILGMTESISIASPSDLELLNIDPEGLPEDLDQFLAAISVIAKSTYDKVMTVSTLSSHAIASQIKLQLDQHKEDLLKRISFHKFQVHSLCLFLPTKNPQAWAAFHVDTPHYFLDLKSDPAFDARVKKREWILATISEMESIVSGEGGDINPFGLAKGIVYHLCKATFRNVL